MRHRGRGGGIDDFLTPHLLLQPLARVNSARTRPTTDTGALLHFRSDSLCFIRCHVESATDFLRQAEAAGHAR